MQPVFYALLLFTSLLWAGNFVAGKFLVDHASAFTLTSYRWIISILCLIPLVWWKERKLLPPKKAILPLFLMGLTGVVLFNMFMFFALERTSADNVGLLSALNPVSIAIASFFLMREKMSFTQLTSMLISLLGVITVITNGHWQHLLSLKLNAGDLYMITAVGTWGLYSVVGRKAMQYVSPFMSTLWSGIFGVLVLLPFNYGSFTITNPDPAFWISLLYTSIGATVVAMLLWNLGVQQIGATKSGVFLNFNPIFTAILSYFILGEHLTSAQIIGTILVISGVYLFTSNPKFRPLPGSQTKKASA